MPLHEKVFTTLSDEKSSSSTSSLLNDASQATDGEDGIRQGHDALSKNSDMNKKLNKKRQRISDQESTNREEVHEECFMEVYEQDDNIKSHDDGNTIIPRDEQTSHVKIKKVSQKVPITPDREISVPIAHNFSKHTKQLGVGICTETSKKKNKKDNAAAATNSKSGRSGTRSTTSSRPRKIWSKLKEEEKTKATTRPRPKKKSSNKTTKDDEQCWYYYCPFCHHRFAFPKDEDLPPLDEQFNVSDRVPWGDLRFHQRIQTVRRHMRNKHPNVPESTWPAGYAKVSRGLYSHDEDYIEIDSSDSASTNTSPEGAREKEYKYPCFIEGCRHVFLTKGWGPPLNESGEISDNRRWNSGTFRNVVRSHMRLKHPDVNQLKWPCGFSKLHTKETSDMEGKCGTEDPESDRQLRYCKVASSVSKKAGPVVEETGRKVFETNYRIDTGSFLKSDKETYFNYYCPVSGCEEVFRIPSHLKPPLDDDSCNVTDMYPWPPQLDYVRQWVHFHIRKDHADFIASYATPQSERDSADTYENGDQGTDLDGYSTCEEEVERNDDGHHISNGENRAVHKKKCCCSYQQCWHRS